MKRKSKRLKKSRTVSRVTRSKISRTLKRRAKAISDAEVYYQKEMAYIFDKPSYEEVVKRWGRKRINQYRRTILDKRARYSKIVKGRYAGQYKDWHTGKRVKSRKVVKEAIFAVRRGRMVEEVIYRNYQKTGRLLKGKTARKRLDMKIKKRGYWNTVRELIGDTKTP